MMTCCIIDDEPHAIAVLKRHIEKAADLTLLFSETDVFAALKCLAASPQPPDIVFCDIEMPDMSGMEVGALIPEGCQLVFTTAYQQYAIDGYKINAVDYLLKPIFYESFAESVLRCRKRRASKIKVVKVEVPRVPSLLIHTDLGNYMHVISDRLIYIRTVGNYLHFFTEGIEEPQSSYTNFKKLIPALDQQRFVRVHRAYIVNIAYISEIKSGKIYLTNCNQTIELSRSYRKKLIEIFGDRHF